MPAKQHNQLPQGRKPATPVRIMTPVARTITHEAQARLNTRRDLPDTQIARASGIARNTVRRFREEPRDDMSLRLFLAIFNESNGDPVQAIADALADDNDWKEVET